MKQLRQLYVFSSIVLLPILLLLYLSSVEVDVYASPRQQPASLTIHKVGDGTVAKDPDQLSYQYGDVVTLTATANLGWMFSDWSGDLTGSNNPETLTIDSDKIITATFTQEEYSLTVGVNPIGSGSVDKDPDQENYHYGDVVTLTATADPGWTFDSWSGDLSGSDNPETLTIDGNKTVTATFQDLSVIDVWYGSHQVFGHLGNPQRWVNILGNVSDPDGIDSLTYSLNGGPELPLSIGPDSRRLYAEGDFNVEIDYEEDLSPGLNVVVITATDSLNHQTVETVTVEYVEGNVWPEPYDIEWNSVTAIPDVAQIVDGLWTLEADSIRPDILGYDRNVAIGDMTWDDYEVKVPIIIHGADPVFEFPSGGAAIGIAMRWNGHVAWDDSQPTYGWYPLGALGWYDWQYGGGNSLSLRGNEGELIAEDTSRTLELGVPYNFKMHVETVTGQGGLYGFKVWEASQPEPSEWDFVGQEGLADPQNGSFLLMAHHVDASFGAVAVTPGPFEDVIQPIISNPQITPTETSAMITWNTNEPATSTVSYGPSSAYENGSVTDSALVTEHTITLTGLIPGTLYHYQITSEDEHGNAARSTDSTFRTTGVPPGIVSDDFNTCELNTGLWEFIDPVGDAAQDMTGTFTEDAWLSISVPAGVSHDVWTDNRAPRIMQPANDTNFEIEVKFESGLSERYQIQGVLVEQDSDNFLRFDFHSDGTNTMIFAASFTNGSPHEELIHNIASGAPLYMRVRRTGHTWTLSYSYDGENWETPPDSKAFLKSGAGHFYPSEGALTEANTPSWDGATPTGECLAPCKLRMGTPHSDGSFTHALSVAKVGAFVGNSGSSPPAHTGSIDYFFNRASPIVLEDGDRNTLTVDTVGDGEVTEDPDKPMYDCDEEVTLTAAPDPDWTFSGWSGDLSGSTNPATVTMTGSRVITATFAQLFSLTITTDGSGSVEVYPEEDSYPDGETVTLTATADPGWSFTGWSGDLSGSTNPATVTMTGSRVITATFTQLFSLTVTTDGSGSVEVYPEEDSYPDGETVTLTATADPGWSFTGWDGDLSGTTNPATLIMDSHKAVTAIFTKDEVQIFLPLITVQYSP